MSLTKIEGILPCPQGRFALVVSRFNSFICERLLDGALDTLKREGQVPEEQITIIHVPGAIEIPLTCQKACESKKFDAVIALGCVIRGNTYHFEVVANECAKGLSQVNLKYGIPVTNGVLTTDNLDQAVQRAGSKMGNKGSEAAASALEMVNVMRQL